MTRSQRLDPLLKIRQRKQDEAAQLVAERERAHAEQQQRLEALRQYAAEYSAPVAATLHPALLANRIAFREKLDAAVTQQARVVASSQQHCDVERARLLLASRDALVLEKLKASYQMDEARAADKRVQRELDDIAGRRKPRRDDDEVSV